VAVSVSHVTVLGTWSGTLSAAPAAGDTLLYVVTAYTTSGAAISTSSPTYNGAAVTGAVLLKAQQGPGTNAVYTATWMLPNVSAGHTSVGITVTGADTPGDQVTVGLTVYDVTGLGASPSLDKSASSSGTSSAVTSGASGATTQASEIVVGSLVIFGQTMSPVGAPWTEPAQLADDFCLSGYQLLSSSGSSFTYAKTAGGSASWAGTIVTVAGSSPVSVALPAAQVTGGAPLPGTAAGPVALPAAQVTAAGQQPAPSVRTPLQAAQVTAAGQQPSPVFAGGASLPAAQVTVAAPPATGSASVSIALPPAQAGAAAFPPVPGAAVPLHAAQVAAAGHLLAPPASVITVAGTWSGTAAGTAGFFFPFPSARPVQVSVTNTAGDWLFAIVSWRPTVTDSGVSVCVADDAHNWWEPVGNPSTDSDAAGVVRTAVWAAPAARVANTDTGVTVVQVAPTGPVLSLACRIVDMSGLLPWYQVAAIATNSANAATSLSVPGVTPPARALLFAAFGSGDDTKTVTGPSGWTALGTVTATNGTDHTEDCVLTPAWQVTSSPASASVTSSGSQDLAGVIAGVLVSAAQPAQPNPDWPVMVTEVAIGSGAQTPPSEMTWTPLSGRSLSMSIQQGRMYSLGQLQAGQGTIVLDDPDGALIPPGSGSYAGIDSGTPLRRRVTWPGLPGSPALSPHYVAFSGFIRRWPWNMDEALYRGKVQAEIADIWAYGSGQLNAMGIEECLLDDPHSLWPLTDPPGSTGAGSVVPNGAPLPLVESKFGNGGSVVTWGANSGALRGMSSAQVTSSGAPGGASGMFSQQLAGDSLSYSGFGYALVATDSAFPAVTDGVTLEYWAQLAFGAETGFTVPAGSPATFGSAGSFAAGQALIPSVASGFTFPTGITAGQIYFVTGDGGTSFQLATTPGGTGVAVTGAGAGFFTPTVTWNPVILAARGINGAVAQIEVDKLAGHLVLRYRAAGATADTLVTVDAANDYRNNTLSQFTLSFTQTTWRVLVNAGSVATASGTFSGQLPAAFATACFSGVMDRVNQGGSWTGSGAMAGVYPGISQQNRVVSRFWAVAAGMSNETAPDRVERVLEYGGLAGRRWIGQQAGLEGDLAVSGQDTGGQAPVSGVNNIAASTLPGFAAVAPTGDIVYRAKSYTWGEPVRWTLGDDTAAGEIPFQPGSMATDYDPTRVTAAVQLTQLDTQAVTTPDGVMSAQTMGDVSRTAARQYGGTPYQQTGYLDNDWSSPYTNGASLVDLANWVQAVYARPQNRVQSVTVDAASHPEAWPFWAGASAGDMVQVNVRVPTASTSPLISLVARITQTQRSSQFSQDGTSATIAAVLDFAPEYRALTCDDPVRGLLDGSNVLPW